MLDLIETTNKYDETQKNFCVLSPNTDIRYVKFSSSRHTESDLLICYAFWYIRNNMKTTLTDEEVFDLVTCISALHLSDTSVHGSKLQRVIDVVDKIVKS